MTKSPLSRKQIVISLLFFGFLIIGLITAYILSSAPQDIRQQAAGCTEAPVNVEFRKYTGKDEPGWKDGANFKSIKVGDQFDVNCFAKNGSALLSNGKFSIKLDSKTTTIPASAYKSQTEIRGWKIDKPGKWTFTCSNSAGCSNSDSITVTGTAEQKVSCYVYNTTNKTCEKKEFAQANCNTSQKQYATLTECQQNNQSQQKKCYLYNSQTKLCELSSATFVSCDPMKKQYDTTQQCIDANPGGTTNCTTFNPSDLNHDCKVDLLDYDLFLKDFREHYTQP